MISASFDRSPENVRVRAIVISELEFRDVERQIFATDFVEGPDHTAFDDAPKSFNRVRMNSTYDIFPARMIDYRVRVFLADFAVANPAICNQQADFVGDGFTKKGFEGRAFYVVNDASDDVAFASDSASYGNFTGSGRPWHAVAVVAMPVLSFPANESFISFNNPAELPDVFHEGNTNAVRHIPSGFERTEAHIAPELTGTDAFLADQDQVNDTKPIAKRFVRVLENRARDVREPIAVRSALFALPMTPGSERIDLRVPTTGADRAIGPTSRDEIGAAMVFVGKHRLELDDSQLMNLLRLFGAGHGEFSHSMNGECHVR